MLEARSVTGGQKFKEVQEFKSSRVQRGSRVQEFKEVQEFKKFKGLIFEQQSFELLNFSTPKAI
jgi:hypothetical protein